MAKGPGSTQINIPHHWEQNINSKILKVKARLSVYKPQRHVGGVEVYLHSDLTLALDGGKWLVSCPGHSTPREAAPNTNWTGRWVGTSTGFDILEKWPFAPVRIQTPDSPVHRLVMIILVLSQLLITSTKQWKNLSHEPTQLWGCKQHAFHVCSMGLHDITHHRLSLCTNDFWHKEHMNTNCCLNHNELKSSYKIWNVKNVLHYMEVTYYIKSWNTRK